MKNFVTHTIGDVSFNYRLKSLIEHQGDFEGGHYISFKTIEWSKRWDIQTWVQANDDTITFEDEYDAMHWEAYMLFYERELT